MILPVTSLGKEPVTLDLEATAADSQELVDAGVAGSFSLHLDITPLAGDSHLVRSKAEGRLNAECARCLEPVSEAFSVNFNLLLDRKDSTGVEWLEDEDQGIEDYQARLGPDVTEVPLDAIVAEQLVLNYNLHPLPELDAAGRCALCGRQAPVAEEPKKAEGVDPRWAKLADLKGDVAGDGGARPGS
jgi:uncharacterized protein